MREAIARLRASYDAVSELIDSTLAARSATVAAARGEPTVQEPGAAHRFRLDTSMVLVVFGCILVLVALIVGNL